MTTCALPIAAAALGAEPDLTRTQAADSLALVRGEKVVWRFNHEKLE
jgi:hypothetical protein